MTNDSLTPEAGAETAHDVVSLMRNTRHQYVCKRPNYACCDSCGLGITAPCHAPISSGTDAGGEPRCPVCKNLGRTCPICTALSAPSLAVDAEGVLKLPNDEELVKIVYEVFPYDPGFLRTKWKDGIDIEVPTTNCCEFVLRITKPLRDQLLSALRELQQLREQLKARNSASIGRAQELLTVYGQLQRATDLLRHQRHALLEDKLISLEEYAAITSDSESGKRVARLETYDDLRGQLSAALSEIARMKAGGAK